MDTLPLARFNGLKIDTFPRILHEIIEEDKGKKLAFGGFNFPLPVDVEDTKVNPLHMIFYLKGVLVGKNSFIINHFLLLLFNLA
jgi:hypothetical protein